MFVIGTASMLSSNKRKTSTAKGNLARDSGWVAAAKRVKRLPGARRHRGRACVIFFHKRSRRDHQLTNLELSGLIAETPDQFVGIAVALARALDRLRLLRASLRQRMQRSPLMDGRRFARHVEAPYPSPWQRWWLQVSADGARAAPNRVACRRHQAAFLP